MNRAFFDVLLNWPKSYISGTDLHHILDKSPDSRYGILKRAVQEGTLIPIRRDLYLVKSRERLVNAFEIAELIQGPSYISFESALSFHGWIPEAVRTTTCAVVKRACEFETQIGVFSYEHIPIEAFSLAVREYNQQGVLVLIADPVKALADMVYTRKKQWSSRKDLFEDLRIEPELFIGLHEKVLEELIQNYPSHRVKKVLKALRKGNARV